MFRKLLAAVSITALLAGCSGGSPLPTVQVNPNTGLPILQASSQQLLQQLGTFTVADVNNALTIAKAGNDIEATQCFTYLSTWLPQVQAQLQTPGITVSGAVSGFEAGRVAVAHGQSLAQQGIPPALNMACAPLVLNAAATLNQLIVQFGGAAAVHVAVPAIINPVP